RKRRLSKPRSGTKYSGPHKLDHPLSYSGGPAERGSDEREAEAAHASVQSPGSPGGDPRRPHGQRTGGAVRGPPDLDPRLEETTAGGSGDALRQRHQDGYVRPRGGPNRAVRAHRPTQNGVGVGEKKSCRLRLTPSGP